MFLYLLAGLRSGPFFDDATLHRVIRHTCFRENEPKPFYFLLSKVTLVWSQGNSFSLQLIIVVVTCAVHYDVVLYMDSIGTVLNGFSDTLLYLATCWACPSLSFNLPAVIVLRVFKQARAK